MSAAAPLWLCFVAQILSVIGDSFGQRAARVSYKNSRRHFIMSLSVISCFQMFVCLGAVQLYGPEFTRQVWIKNTTTDSSSSYDYCSVHPDDTHCYHQGPLTIYRSIQDCPILFADEIVNLVYYMAEATLYSQPLGLLLIVMSSLSSAFIITPLQNWLAIGTTAPIPVLVIILGAVGAVMCIVERKPPPSTESEETIQLNRNTLPAGSSTNIFHLVPLFLPFTILAVTYASFFIITVFFNNACYQNAFGMNSFDQVMFPPFVFAMFLVLDYFQFTRTLFQSEQDQKETFREAISSAWSETMDNKGAGFLVCFTYRFFVNVRGMIYTYLAVLYDLNKVYLQLTLIRVALSWVGSVILIVVVPKFIQTSAQERGLILDPVNLLLKVVGTCCIVAALVLMQ